MNIIAPQDNAAFLKDVVQTVPGWLEDYTALRTMDLLDWQERSEIGGPLLEIGIYAGRYFSLLLRSALRTGDAIVALDTFQWINEKTVRSHLSKVARDHHAQLVKCFSTDMGASDLLQMLGGKPRFVSIDGSHERNDVFWDLRLAEEILALKGIVAVDDFLNPLTLGVNEAVNLFFAQPRNLAPFAYIANKLFLARPTSAGEIGKALEAIVEHDNDPRSQDFRKRAEHGRHHVEQRMWGHPLLILP
jgi:hypothetical protein